MTMFCAFVAVFFFGGVFAQVPTFGRCPKVTTLKNFDISRAMGLWYETERYYNFIEASVSCATADFQISENNTITMSNTFKIFGAPQSTQAVARVPDASEPGKLKMRFFKMPFEADFWVLGTDYETYIVLYSCTGNKLASAKLAWILTRERNPSNAVIAEAHAVAKRHNLQKSLFSKAKQTDCQ